ncbi:hypothetical protein IQ266_17200 [filamentous cyanobacterium LEGE 11480]|uniref:Uncharacterized protein n=1 Tax=Romeriopsis navalis LEGE 11480 TaxID=2777977 RepID=A0A928Z5H2_9CYAN|nr:hypothetical protein [Romeriopsis navalis]MBE9031473.1 hypothetical protein [Romeriopsis navalis LEGE 11480]
MTYYLDKSEPFNHNELLELGNLAVKRNLIIGHGFHQDKYEILTKSEALLLAPKEAMLHLRKLLEGDC